VHYAIPHAYAGYMAKQMLKDEGIPMVTTLHGTDITFWKSSLYKPAVSFSINIVTSVSESLKEDTYVVQYKKRYLRHT
jgi:hypothetical protein